MKRFLSVLVAAAAGAAVLAVATPASASPICPLGLVLDEYPSWSCVNID